jgi:hypothetical protein
MKLPKPKSPFNLTSILLISLLAIFVYNFAWFCFEFSTLVSEQESHYRHVKEMDLKTLQTQKEIINKIK